jgi:hypothetical protein
LDDRAVEAVDVAGLQVREQLSGGSGFELVGGLSSGKRATRNESDGTSGTERNHPPKQPMTREDCPNTHNEKNARCAL